MKRNIKDIAAGSVFMAVAGGFAAGSLQQELGTALDMGAGYFPFMVACGLAMVGFTILVRGLLTTSEPILGGSIRGPVLVLLSPVIFSLAVSYIGIVPSLALATLISAYASQDMRPLTAVLSASVITGICVLIFFYGIGLPYPMFGSY